MPELHFSNIKFWDGDPHLVGSFDVGWFGGYPPPLIRSWFVFYGKTSNSRKALAQLLLLDTESEHCGFPRRSTIQVLTRLMLLNFIISGIYHFAIGKRQNSGGDLTIINY